MKRLLAALRFLTILPIPGTWGTAEVDLAGSVAFFPVVGLLLGVAAVAFAWAAGQVAPPMIVAALVVIAMMSFSGCLHMDGLSDSADGLLSSRSRERMLEIMKDSHVGPMGVIAVVCVLLLKFAALSSLEPAKVWPAVLLMPLAGRAAICLHVAFLPYARPSGLAAVFCRSRHTLAAIWAVALLTGVAYAVLQWRGLIVSVACVAITLLLAVYVRVKLGGATGDTFGAVCEIVEIVPALTLTIAPLDLLR
jgi:adenosylcobinamide-GDP ribazoletransferase